MTAGTAVPTLAKRLADFGLRWQAERDTVFERLRVFRFAMFAVIEPNREPHTENKY